MKFLTGSNAFKVSLRALAQNRLDSDTNGKVRIEETNADIIMSVCAHKVYLWAFLFCKGGNVL